MRMRKMKVIWAVTLLMLLSLASIGLTQQLIDIDVKNRFYFISENAWAVLTYQDKVRILEDFAQKYPNTAWKVRGLYTGKLFGEINFGKVKIKTDD